MVPLGTNQTRNVQSWIEQLVEGFKLLGEAADFIQGDVETWDHPLPCNKDEGKPCPRCEWLENYETLRKEMDKT